MAEIAAVATAFAATSFGSFVVSTATSIGLGLLYQALSPPMSVEQSGSRLDSARITTSTEGSPIPRVWGTVRLGGQIIWATKFRERVVTDTQTSGGKGGGPKTVNKSTEYLYSCSFAVALTEGQECVRLVNVWADGRQLDLSQFTYRFYSGESSQEPDPLIDTVEGSGTVPAFRGVSYIVFEDMALASFGNRIPQISCEISRPVETLEDETYSPPEELIQSVKYLPTGGEKSYGTRKYLLDDSNGNSIPVNQGSQLSESDFLASINELDNECLSVSSIHLPVTWYATSDAVGSARVVPKCLTPIGNKLARFATFGGNPVLLSPASRGEIFPDNWFVSGLNRVSADAVSYRGGRRYDYTITGGLTTFSVTLTSFEKEDLTIVAPDDFVSGSSFAQKINELYSEEGYGFWAEWSSPTLTIYDISSDGTNKIETVVSDSNVTNLTVTPELSTSPDFSNFFTAIPVEDTIPNFLGTPSDISVLEAFTEIKDRNWRAVFSPEIKVDYLGFQDSKELTPTGGSDSNSFLGTCAVSDFSGSGDSVTYSGPDEFSYRRMILHYAFVLRNTLQSGDAFLVGSGLVGFSSVSTTWTLGLSSLISDVKQILPSGVLVSYAADWTEYNISRMNGVWQTADFIAINNFIPVTDWRDGDVTYNIEALQEGIEGGIFYDYTYTSENNRQNGIQTPITNPSSRQKDIRFWHQENHGTKPVWFTSLGVRAVDKGTNQPDAWNRVESNETVLPYFSTGEVDEELQSSYITAVLDYWSRVAPSPYFQSMNMFVTGWDHRPYPYFPNRAPDADADLWSTGPWITGRINKSKLRRIVVDIFMSAGVPGDCVDISRLDERTVEGVLVTGTVPPRQILENLMETYLFDIYEDGRFFRVVSRNKPNRILIDSGDLKRNSDDTHYEKTRAQDIDLPDRTKVSFLDRNRDYNIANVDGHTVTGFSTRINQFTSICVLSSEYAKRLADILTQQARVGRDSIKFTLPISYNRIQAGDVFSFSVTPGITKTYKIAEIIIGDEVEVEATTVLPPMYEIFSRQSSNSLKTNQVVSGRTKIVFADIPLFEDTNPADHWSPRIIAYQRPWPGAVNVYEDDFMGGLNLNTTQPVLGGIGETVSTLNAPVFTDVWDNANSVDIRLYNPDQSLYSASDLAVLNGSNAIGIMTPSGEWEILQYANAEALPDGSYRLSRLLRGQLGTEAYIGTPTLAGAQMFVADQTTYGSLSGTVARIGLNIEYGYGPSNVLPSDDRYIYESVTARGVALRPYAPTHLSQNKISDNIVLSWIRRARFGGDNWGSGEIPVYEDLEAYDVFVYDDSGNNILRTLRVENSSNVSYTESQQIADFGVLKDLVNFSVTQISSTYGSGTESRKFFEQ